MRNANRSICLAGNDCPRLVHIRQGGVSAHAPLSAGLATVGYALFIIIHVHITAIDITSELICISTPGSI